MRRRWIVLFVLGCLVLGGFLFRAEITDRVRAWRYDAAIEEAREALDSGDRKEVARLTGAALRLTSGRIEEVRELFDLASSVRSRDSISLAEILFEHPEVENTDRIEVLEFVAGLGESFYLEGFLARLEQVELEHPRVLAIRIRAMLWRGDRLNALLLLDELSDVDLELPALRVLKGQVLAGESGNPLAWQEARRILGDLMIAGKQTETLQAYRGLLLLPDKELQKWEEPDLSHWVEEHPNAGPEDKLGAAHWRLLRDPKAKEEVLNGVLALAGDAPEQVARWVLEHQNDEVILERDLDLNSKSDYPFFLARLQHFLNKESWEQAEALLESPHRVMKASLLLGFQAAVSNRLKNEVSHLRHLQEALRSAKQSEDHREFVSLFEVGKRLGDEVLRRRACEGLVKLPARFLPGGESLAFLEFEFGEEPEFLLSLYQNLHAAKPDDPVVTYRKALIDYVTTGNSEASLKGLNWLLEDYPKATSIRFAKALVIAGESVEEAFTFLRNDRGETIPMDGAVEKAIFQYLLRLRGEDEAAMRYARQVDWSNLPPYLSDFLKPKK